MHKFLVGIVHKEFTYSLLHLRYLTKMLTMLKMCFIKLLSFDSSYKDFTLILCISSAPCTIFLFVCKL